MAICFKMSLGDNNKRFSHGGFATNVDMIAVIDLFSNIYFQIYRFICKYTERFRVRSGNALIVYCASCKMTAEKTANKCSSATDSLLDLSVEINCDKESLYSH